MTDRTDGRLSREEVIAGTIRDFRRLWQACPAAHRLLCFRLTFLGVVRLLDFRWLKHNLPLHFQAMLIITMPIALDAEAFAGRAEEAWAAESRNA